MLQQDHPVERKDRRIRARSREGYSDRRKFPRYLANVPVEIRVAGANGDHSYFGTILDLSDGGLLLNCPTLPSDSQKIGLRFRIPDGVMPEEFTHGDVVLDGQVVRESQGKFGVEFGQSLSTKLSQTVWRYVQGLAVLLTLVSLVFIFLIKYENLYYFWYDVPVYLYSLVVGGYLVSRFLFASFYKKTPPASELPRLTVLCPAFNEEKNIARTLTQLMESAYPSEKLQAIVINDGSTDGTLQQIQQVRQKYPELILVNFQQHRGKRKALAAGARLATGDIVVFIDSDSFVEPDALRNIVRPFADPEVAAVTGHCDVDNKWTNALTKMQAVRYFVAFRIMKAAESVFGSVTCLSGPLAAYRRNILEEVLNEWVSQTFLGQPATFGDDRSLTNALLRRGYRVVYEETARTTTAVPDQYRTFFRQQMRWKRSWFRESLRACAFMWKRPPLMAASFYLGFLLPLLSPFIVARALLYVPIYHHQAPLTYLFGVFLMSSLMSSAYLLFKRSRLWFYGVPFCFFYMFVLVWQLPWAVLTATRSGWGTRTESGPA